MKTEIEKIYLSTDLQTTTGTSSYDDAHVDVMVKMINGEKYIATFYTYKNLNTLQSIHQEKGDFLNGKYFWMKGMLMVEDCARKNIELVIEDLIAEGDFIRVFVKIA